MKYLSTSVSLEFFTYIAQNYFYDHYSAEYEIPRNFVLFGRMFGLAEYSWHP